MCFVFWAFTPNPSAQNPKRKKKFENFLKQPTIVGKKKRNTSANTAYLVTAFIQKPPPIFSSASLRKTSHTRERYMK